MRSITTLQLFFLLGLLVGCGTNTGNPFGPKPSEDDETIQVDEPGDDTETVANTIDGETVDLPVVSLALADSVTSDDGSEAVSLALVDKKSKCSSVLTCALRRVQKSVSGVEKIVKRLKNDDGVNRGGKFRKKGPKRTLSGIVLEIEDSIYSYQAEVCKGDKPLLLMRWSGTGDRIMYVRDHSQAPLNGVTEAQNLTKIEVVKQTDTTSYIVSHQGETYKTDDRATDGDLIRERVELLRNNQSGSVQAKGVSDWHNPGEATTAGDVYFVGEMDEAGEGVFMGYRKSLTNVCSEGFDEDRNDLWSIDRSTPGFCYARSTKNRKVIRRGQYENVASRLQPLGIAKAADLVDFRLAFTRKCNR